MTENYKFFKVFSAACLGMLLFGIVIISVGSILPAVIEKFSLSTLQAGSLASILPLGILIGSVFFGPIVDRYSYKYLLIACSLMIILGLEGIAFANNFKLLQFSVFIIGIGGGAINGGTNALVADISEEGRSANLSLLGVFFGVGALTIPVILSTLNAVYSFEQILMFMGLLIVIAVLYFALIRFPKAKQTQAISFRSSVSMFKNKHLILLGMFLFFQSAVEGIINNWSTTFLQTHSLFEIDSALVALSIFVLSLVIARLVLAFILRLVPPFKVLIISIALLAIGALLMGIGVSKASMIGALILLGLGCAAGFPVILGWVSELYSDLRGTAFSFVFFLALIGNTIINYLIGILSNSYGLGILPWMIFACVICLLLIILIILPRLRNQSEINST